MTLMHRLVFGVVAPEPRSTRRQEIGECRILASSASRYTQAHILASKEIDGPLCQSRKGFFDHLKPRPFITSTIRVVTQQGTMIMAQFMTDQLEQDMKRNELVDEGKLSRSVANEQAEDWEKDEWEKRWKVFPSRLLTSFAKYHAITLVIRSYEYIAAQFYDKVVLDRLTTDPFRAARKVAAKTDDNRQIATQMFHTTFWANLIAFMADFSVHQVILCYGYYVYYKGRRREQQGTGDKDKEGVDGAMMTSLLKKSTELGLSRGLGLVCSAAGGAVGTVVWPGWGTLLFANMGEGAAGVILEDGKAPSNK